LSFPLFFSPLAFLEFQVVGCALCFTAQESYASLCKFLRGSDNGKKMGTVCNAKSAATLLYSRSAFCINKSDPKKCLKMRKFKSRGRKGTEGKH
jgi:hypothetical protein